MIFQRKKRILQKLDASFGNVKTERFNLEQIKRYFESNSKSDLFQVISDQTKTLFFFVRTSSK